MQWEQFILQHDEDDLARLALSRERLFGEVDDFDLALTTLECRRKLRNKVPEWWAVPSLRFPLRLSAEQCSSSATARYKASVALNACSGKRLADLTGGLGVDSWAFAQVFDQVLYNEMQPALADAARSNFAALGLDNVTVRNSSLAPQSVMADSDRSVMADSDRFVMADSDRPSPASAMADSDRPSPASAMADSYRSVMVDSDRPSPGATVAEILNGFEPDILFLDPARRSSDGRKVFRLEDCQPDVLTLLPELLDACPLVLLKLSPMADITLVCKQLKCVKAVHVVAAEGECKELLLLLERGYEGDHSITVYENGSILEVDQVQGTFGLGPKTSAGPGPSNVPPKGLEAIGAGPGPGDEIGPRPKKLWTRSKPEADEADEADVTDVADVAEPQGLRLLFEPGKALLKAGAFDLPCRYGLRKIGQHTHLYVSEDSVPDALRPFGKCYQILEVTELNNRKMKEIGKAFPMAEVTARNIPLTSEQLRVRMGVRSGGDVHVFGVQAAAGRYLLVCRRLRTAPVSGTTEPGPEGPEGN